MLPAGTESAMNKTNLSSGVPLRCGWPKEPKIEQQYAVVYLDQATFPVLLIIATAGSIFNVLVFSKEKPTVSKTVYLAAMACTDFGYM